MPSITSRNAALGVAIYAAFWRWRNGLLNNAVKNASTIGPIWFRILMCRILRKYAEAIGVRVVSESGPGLECDQSRRYMITWHPHGFIVFCPIFLFAERSIVGEPHGSQWHCTGAPIIFKLPLLGEMLMLINGRPVDKRSLDSIISKGGSVAIQPGGMAEQAITRHDQEQAVFAKNLGFIRIAIQAGTPILPLYIFGENQLATRVEGREWLTNLIKSGTGFTLPFWRGRFGIPQIPVPMKTDIHARWGNPIEVGPADPNPSEEHVEEVFRQYLLELQKIFYDNCYECLPPDVAAKGLKIIRLDGKPVPALHGLKEAATGISELHELIESDPAIQHVPSVPALGEQPPLVHLVPAPLASKL